MSTEGENVSNRLYATLGPACGVVCSAGLFVLPQHELKPAHLAAFALLLPFVAYLYSLLRKAEGDTGWLSQTAFAAATAGITLKLASIAPEIAITRAHLADGTPLHDGLQGIADAATVLSLYPLGIMAAAVCAVGLRTHVLPRWLSAVAGITAVALIINGSFLDVNNVPALLLFLLWILLTGSSLLRRAWRKPAQLTNREVAAAT
jgi:hypothetical protein